MERLESEGRQLFLQGAYLEAVDRWNRILAQEPWNEEIKNLIERALDRHMELTKLVREAYTFLEKGELDKAEGLFLQAESESHPSSRHLYELITRGMRSIEQQRNEHRYALLLEEGDRLLEREDFQGARAMYEAARRFHPRGGEYSQRIALLESRIRQSAFESRVAALRDKALHLYRQGEYESSREEWNRLLGLKPDDQEALVYLSKIAYIEQNRRDLLARGAEYFERGVNLYGEGEYTQAITQLENAIALDYQVQEALELIDRIREDLARVQREEQERNAELVARHLREGIKLYNLNRYNEALHELNKGLRIDPENTQVREYILRATLAIKREKERVVDPASPFYKLVQDLARLGEQYYRQGEYPESIRRWEEILLLFPFNEMARRNLTRTLAMTDPSLAGEILEGMYQEARNLLENGSRREAAARLEMVLEVQPDNRKARDLLADTRTVQREQKSREERRVTEQDRAEARSLYEQGVQLYAKERLQDAVEVWRRALDLDPGLTDARVALSRGETMLRNLRSDPGRQELTGLTEAQRIRVRRHYLQGVDLFLAEKYREAISEWEEVVRLAPDYENVRRNIERARQRLELGKSS
jgi:tetratricopeptide (TPR) repeat protein